MTMLCSTYSGNFVRKKWDQIDFDLPKLAFAESYTKWYFVKKWAKPGLFLVYFRSFSQHKDKFHYKW